MNRNQNILRRTLPAIGLLVLATVVFAAVSWQETTSASILDEASSDDAVAHSAVESGPDGFQLFGEAAKLFALDGIRDQHFGESVAISGSTVVVGAPSDRIDGVLNKGSVYVYVRDGSQWTLQQKLIAPDVGEHEHFGWKVAIDGDTIVVGVPYNGNGSAYVFTRNGTSWGQQQKLTTSNVNSRFFGDSVALSGDTLVATDRNQLNWPGKAYVFQKIGPTWVEQQTLVAQEAVNSDYFAGVALSGDDILLGCPPRQIGSFGYQGAVYSFSKVGSQWLEKQRLVASDGEGFDYFGRKIAMSGETAVIGVSADDDCPLQDSGSAYVFVKQEGRWTERQRLTAPDAHYDSLFGSSVGVSGDIIVVGAPFQWYGYNQWQGAGYVFRRSGNSWSFVQKLLTAEGDRDDRLGFSGAIDGETVVFGAYTDTIGGNNHQGSISVFSEGLPVSPSPTITPTPTPTPIPTPSATPTPFEPVWTHFRTSPVGLTYLVDSATYTTPQMLPWMVGSTHTIGTTSPQGGPAGTRYVFTRWNDCGPMIHTVRAGWSEFYPIFVTQFRLTKEVAPQGTGTISTAPAAGDSYYAWEKDVTLTAVPAPGYRFVGWTGSGSGSYTGSNNPAVVTVNSPITQTALFAPLKASFDYDGDGKTDFSVFRPSRGSWYLQRSTEGFFGLQFGGSSGKIAPADYDGDGKTDVAAYQPSTGVWSIFKSATSTVTYPVFGVAEDLPLPADYDGDGKADLMVFRPSQGTWYRQNSSNGAFAAFQFGTNGDVPTTGDFDGDGKNDIGVFRPSVTEWYNLRSSDGSVFAERFGLTGDRIAPADYDGDGKTDIAIYRPSTGLWVVRNSAAATYSYYVFGAPADVPVAGDYDGDGKADIAVWRPSDGTWYVQRSSNGTFLVFPWGQNGDVPTPAAFGN